MTEILEVDPIGATELVEKSGAILLDVREDDEWAAGHAPGAVHVRLGDLDAHDFDTATPVVAVCRSGKRSGLAAAKLAAAEVTVYNLVGGMGAWQETGQPVIRDDGTAGTVS
ncbi:rhodanese-like domain-containing protein [soil metagenome]